MERRDGDIECTFREVVNIGLVILSANSICGEECVRNINRYPGSSALPCNWQAKKPQKPHPTRPENAKG